MTVQPSTEVVLLAHALNGERPGWDDRSNRLFWVDIRGPAWHCFDPGTKPRPSLGDAGLGRLLRLERERGRGGAVDGTLRLRYFGGRYRALGPQGEIARAAFREARWRFQRARNVVVVGYAVETPRLLLMSATGLFPQGLANASGLVGKNLMTQPNQAVFGQLREEIRWSKAPPSRAITEHWNDDDAKDFHGGYCWMAQGPLPMEWMKVLTGSRGLWGERLRLAVLDYNHQVGLKMVGEGLPREDNRVELADETDRHTCRSRASPSAGATTTRRRSNMRSARWKRALRPRRGDRPVPPERGCQPSQRHGPHGG